mmetsp:Transcript_42618/g.110129  ORF Transcript_42618/g.110129 Transcript_42618/m.110129 type:complete len:293 (-) Transcript_42618:1776-2654(-)
MLTTLAADLVAIVEHANRHAERLLDVALQKEFVTHQVGPSLVGLEALDWVGNVAHVQDGAQPKHVLRLEHVLQIRAGLRLVRISPSDAVTELRVQSVHLVHALHHVEVVRIVRGEDSVDADCACLLEAFLAELLEDVGLVLLADLEEPGAVHILERGFVVVQQGELALGFHQERIRLPDVAQVVAKGGHQECEDVHFGEPLHRPQVTDHTKGVVCDIDAVRVVVVRVVEGVPSPHRILEAMEGVGVGEVPPRGASDERVEEYVEDDARHLVDLEAERVPVPGGQRLFADRHV